MAYDIDVQATDDPAHTFSIARRGSTSPKAISLTVVVLESQERHNVNVDHGVFSHVACNRVESRGGRACDRVQRHRVQGVSYIAKTLRCTGCPRL